jgi:hypothetical protein
MSCCRTMPHICVLFVSVHRIYLATIHSKTSRRRQFLIWSDGTSIPTARCHVVGISHIRLAKAGVYLATALDLVSRRLLGYS